ncbi:MAG: hypothetical protein IPM39_16915 [Chloroflexi bacterium]|nr:hypothetical protein [Chloroflexota bacterium]
MTQEPAPPPTADYLAYMLRFWREEPDAPWRATAENPHTGEKRSFAAPEQLWIFLQEKLLNSPKVKG